jgi:DinB superfamily
MNLPEQLAKHFREVYSGGNWTGVNRKDTLKDVTWQQATTKVDSLNTIAALVYHINYYIGAALMVLHGEPLNAHDKYSFDLPPILSQQDWENLLHKTRADAETFAHLVEQLPESKLWETFAHEKYGNYYRNIAGIIEHTHYHLGQIVIIKKIILQRVKNVGRE